MGSAYEEFIQNVQQEIIAPLITLIGLGALAFFVWGMVDFIRNAENAEKRATGARHMIWGLAGMVIIFGAQAILAIINATVGN